MNRAQILKSLVPGVNAFFGMEIASYENEHTMLFATETSNRAFEEDVLFPGFSAATTKPEGSAVAYDSTGEGWVARYNHETIALAFALTEEAMEDNLYESLSKRLSKSLARSMHHTKEVKGATVYNNGFSTATADLIGDGVALFSTSHPLKSGATASNKPATDADLSEAALEDALIAIQGFVDDRGIPTQILAKSLHIHRNNLFVAERLLQSQLRPGTADNDINAIPNLGMLPGGYTVNQRFTDTDAWFIRTDCPDGMKVFDRVPLSTKMEGDFETGNVRYKARERYSFGTSDWRGVYGTSGS